MNSTNQSGLLYLIRLKAKLRKHEACGEGQQANDVLRQIWIHHKKRVRGDFMRKDTKATEG